MNKFSLRTVSVLVLISCALLALATSGCRKDRGLPPEILTRMKTSAADDLRIGFFGFPTGLNPFLNQDGIGRLLGRLIHRGPLQRLPDGEYVADLFASFVTTNDEEGNLIVEGQWREGLTWHDGTPFNPNDLAYTIDYLKSVPAESAFSGLAAKVLEVSSFGRPSRTRIRFAGSSRQYLEILALGVLPKHLNFGNDLFRAEYLVASDGRALALANPEKAGDAETATGTVRRFSAHPIGLGPFKLVESAWGRYLTFDRHTAWPVPDAEAASGGGTSVQRILVQCYPDIDGLINDFRQNHLDWINIPVEIARQIEELKIPAARVVRHPNPSCLFWGFNTEHPALQKAEVRRALAGCLNGDRLRQSFSIESRYLPRASGTAGVASGPLFPVCEIPGDVKALLAAGGIADTDGDRRLDFAGSPVRFDVLINEESLLRKEVAQVLRAGLEEHGFGGAIESCSWSEFLGSRLAAATTTTFLASLDLSPRGNWTNLFLASPPLGQSLNFTRFRSPELERCILDLDRVTPEGDPVAVRREALDILAREVPGIFLLQPLEATVIHGRVQGPVADICIWDHDIATFRLGTGQGS